MIAAGPGDRSSKRFKPFNPLLFPPVVGMTKEGHVRSGKASGPSGYAFEQRPNPVDRGGQSLLR
jgi:hypothetical protein